MPSVVIRHPDGTQQEVPLRSQLVIGRGEGSDILLVQGGVSRKHARIALAPDGRVTIEDLGSSNGTFVDGQRIEGPTPLEGATAQVGEYQLTLKAAPARAAPAPPRPQAGSSAPTTARPRVTAPAPARPGPNALSRAEGGEPSRARPSAGAGAPMLKGLSGPWAGRRYAIQAKLLVGRQEPANIILDDSSVSRRHAELEPGAAGVAVRDLQSANGTLLNGQPLTSEAVLQNGDVLQFGVVEFGFELEQEREDVPVRRSRDRGVSRSGRGAPADEGTELSAVSPKKLALVLGSLSAAVLIIVLVLVKLSSGPATPPTDNPLRPGNGTGGVDELLAKCRTYAATDLDTEPRWDQAQEACNRVLDKAPMNAAALALLKTIRQESQAQHHLLTAEKDLDLFKPDDAIAELAQIPADSYYHARALQRAQDAMAAVQKKAGEDCKMYLHDKLYRAALPQCERYMNYACQSMTEDQLRPPVGYRLNLGNGRLRKREWRPKDPMYLSFLRTRQRVEPSATPWECHKLLQTAGPAAPAAPNPQQVVKNALAQRFPEELLRAPVLNYWSGKSEEAIAELQRCRQDMRRAAFHPQCDELKREVLTVYNLFQKGEGELSRDDADRAADTFREVLDQDKQLMQDLADKEPSFFKRSIQQDMGNAGFTLGKRWYERQDLVQACHYWKLGNEFNKGNMDVLRGLQNVCTAQGGARFQAAQSCSDLDGALQLAVDGDGWKEQIQKKKSQLGCP